MVFRVCMLSTTMYSLMPRWPTLPLLDMFGDDADDISAGGQSTVGQGAHQADPASTIDDAGALLRRAAAKLRRELKVSRVDVVGGAAVNTQVL